jgi:hypothetical protein
MRFNEFNEARKNPEQNPKTPINDIIINAERGTEDSIAGTKNLFVSFTDIDKLGINPKSKYDTPIGIYSYPASYVVRIAGSQKKMSSLPFAGSSPYANLFSASGNIINVATMDAAEVRGYYKALAELWAKTSGRDWKTSVDQVESYINDAPALAKFRDFPGGQLWYVTMMAARELFAPAWKTKPHIAWNKLFRSIGIDGAVDYTDQGGEGIIHTSEPTQAVFFAINSVNNVKRYDNSYSPDLGNRAMSQELGQSRHENIAAIAAKLKTLKTPEEVFDFFKNEVRSMEHIRLIKDPAAREYMIQKDPYAIGRIPHPSKREQYIALSKNFAMINYIKQPDESVVVKVLQDDPNIEFDMGRLADKMPNAGEAIQLAAVKAYPYAIGKFTKPVPNAVILAIQRLDPVPPWLIAIAKKAGVDASKYVNPESYPAVKDLRNEYALVQRDYKLTQEKILDLKSEWEELKLALGPNSSPEKVEKYMAYYTNDIKKKEEFLAKVAARLEYIQAQIKQELAKYGA